MAARKPSNLIEQHVEKAVLGICAVLFLYGLFHWVVASPLTIKRKPVRKLAEQVPVTEIDRAIAQDAREMASKMEGADRLAVEVMPDYQDTIARLRTHPFPMAPGIMDLAAANLPVRVTGMVIAPATQISLAELVKLIPAPAKPLVKASRELPRAEPLEDTNCAHGVAVFPVGELVAAWQEKVRGLRGSAQPVFVAAEVEARQRRPGGDWSPARTAKVKAVPLLDRDNEVILPPEIPPLEEDKAREEINAAIRELAQTRWQQRILQPEYYDVWWAGGAKWLTWRVHLPQTELSDLVEQPRGVPDRRYLPMPVPGTYPRMPVVPRSTPKRKTTTKKPKTTVRPMYPPGYRPGEMPPGLYPGGRMPILPPTKRPARPTPKRPTVAKRKKPKLEIPLAMQVRPEETPVPSYDLQVREGKVLVWFHDPSLESTMEYGYRVRLKIFSPLFGNATDAKNPADAQERFVSTPWSEWSEAVLVPRATEFFLLAGANPNEDYVQVVVFGYSLGQRVRKIFKVTAGDMIGGKARVEVLNPATFEMQTRTVDFTTGAWAVEVITDRRVRKKAISPDISSQSAVLLYQDEGGRLNKRIGYFDEKSSRYERLKAEADLGRAPAVSSSP